MDRSKARQVCQSITGVDFLQMAIGDAPPRGLSDWLTQRIRLAIADGSLPAGSRLPASRALAADLGVSRGVVTEAYQRLIEDGQAAGHGRAGTVIVAASHAVIGPSLRASGAPAPAAPEPTACEPTAPEPAAVFAAAPDASVFDSLRAAPARIDLSPGVPDLAAFPRAAWLQAERAVLGRLTPADFGYPDPRGAPVFRLAVATWLARNRGIRVSPDEVIIVAGVAQALALLARSLRHSGIRAVAVEDPGSLGARQQLQAWRMDTPPVQVDADGLRVGELRAAGAAAVMLTPAHQFPTGVVLSGPRRRELAQWARDGGLIIEDDYDAEHRYDRPPAPALRSLLPEHVCYTGSVSKLLAPALRVGWLLVPRRYRDAVIAAKRDADLGSAVLPQLVLAELMESGRLERQLRMTRRRHRRRRDAMISSIRTHLPGARIHGAAAGLHLLITFDAAPAGASLAGTDLAGSALAGAALARGVKVQPLSWHCQRPHLPGLILGYAASTPGQISDGVAALGGVLRERFGGFRTVITTYPSNRNDQHSGGTPDQWPG